jgi:tRNA pseudouridine38-40 synthase
LAFNALATSPDSAYWRFDFQASAFLHHMIRNLMGCFVAIGQGLQPPDWMHAVLASAKQKSGCTHFFTGRFVFFRAGVRKHLGLADTNRGL